MMLCLSGLTKRPAMEEPAEIHVAIEVPAIIEEAPPSVADVAANDVNESETPESVDGQASVRYKLSNFN